MNYDGSSWVGAILSEGRYRITDKLGGGGMAFVFKARDHRLGGDVVIKAPHPEKLANAQFAGRFVREIRSMVQLSHPHIVKVLDSGEHESIPFAVMQFLAGGSLRDRQRSGPEGSTVVLAPAALLDWLKEVARALDFIHSQGFIHRDVKPDNILFDGAGQVFLSDFGVAKVMADTRPAEDQTLRTHTGAMIGTPRYLAPEVLKEKDYDGRVDQYALAVMVYELLCGRPPFEGAPAMVAALNMYQKPPLMHEIQPTIPRAVSAAVHQALEKDPKKRYPSCTAFARAVLHSLKKGKVSHQGHQGAYAPRSPALPALPPLPPTKTAPVPVAFLDQAANASRKQGADVPRSPGALQPTLLGELLPDASMKPGANVPRVPGASTPPQRAGMPSIFVLGLAFEAGLGVLALVLGWLFGPSPLETLRWSVSAVLLGAAACLPMLVLFVICVRWPLGPLARIKQASDEFLKPLFAPCNVPELAFLSLAAGVGEEMLFRGYLQAACAAWLGPWPGLAAVCFLFGLLHMINPTYAVLAGLMGYYLGWLWLANGDLLSVMVAHGLYDFLALVYLVKIDSAGPGVRSQGAKVPHAPRPTKPTLLGELLPDASMKQGANAPRSPRAPGFFRGFVRKTLPAGAAVLVLFVAWLMLSKPTSLREGMDNAGTKFSNIADTIGTREWSGTIGTRGWTGMIGTGGSSTNSTGAGAKLPREVTNSIGMKLMLIPAGKFRMGSPLSDSDRKADEGPQHDVEITRPFYMGAYEVTQAEYERVMVRVPSWFSTTGGGQFYVRGQDTSRFPVESVSWNDAVRFCQKLSEMPEEKGAGREYRLPTEAEWEYACRANTTTVFHFGNTLFSSRANFTHGTDGFAGGLRRTTKVGSYPAHDFGLYDMHGNVEEWCADWYDEDYYKRSPLKDPEGPTAGSSRVIRGGSWNQSSTGCRAAYRDRFSSSNESNQVGFRVVLIAPVGK